MKMKDVIMLTGVPERTIRFYEERGMLQVPTERRNGRNYHEFTEENVQDLKRIVILRKARFSLDEIQEMRNAPEQIEAIVTGNFARLEAEQQEIQRLTQDEELKTAADWDELSRRVERSLRAIPGYEVSLRFGVGDDESQEEKQAAIAAYRKNAKARDNILLYVFIGLSAFFLCMAVIFGALLYQASRAEPTATAVEVQREVPAPSGTTDGWIYYKLDRSIARAREDGLGEEVIYESGTENSVMQFIVDTEKIYILDDNQLFSVNADGSGLYEYPAEILSEYTNGGGGGWLWDIFLLYGDNIYVMQHEGADTEVIVRVPVDGGEQTELDIDFEHLTNVCGWVWDDILYVYGVDVSANHMDEIQFETYFTSTVTTYNLVQDKRLAISGGAFATSCAQGLYFDENVGYFYNANSMEEGVYELIRVTRENPDGEIFRRYPDLIWAVYEDWVLLATEAEGTVTNFYLENIETGARVDLGPDISLDMNFTPVGLRVGIGEFVPYP